MSYPQYFQESKTPVMYLKSGRQWVLQDYVGILPRKNKLTESFSRERTRAEAFQERLTLRK